MKYLVAILAATAALSDARAADDVLKNCEYTRDPVIGIKENLTGKDIIVGEAECERQDGADFTTTVYCAVEHAYDPTACANDQSIPVLKTLGPPPKNETKKDLPRDSN
ncbi:MAG TPA: hypothetical protein VFV50_03145 [Bdellovibrionales bacterium]|nr:hypothetical protein [Bdellovibrionales bacterium]